MPLELGVGNEMSIQKKTIPWQEHIISTPKTGASWRSTNLVTAHLVWVMKSLISRNLYEGMRAEDGCYHEEQSLERDISFAPIQKLIEVVQLPLSGHV